MIKIEHAGDVVILKLQNGKANALDAEFCNTLADEIDVHAQSSVRALVLLGEGRIFSAGVDLKRTVAGGRTYASRLLPAMNRLFETVFFLPKPVVAGINGHAIAGGCILACAADRRIAADTDLRMGVPELQVGVAFPPVAVEIMRQVLDPRHFHEVMLLGATRPLKTARSLGMIDRIVKAENLAQAVEQEARTLAAIRPQAFALSKRQMRAPARARLDAAGATDHDVRLDWETPDSKQAMQDYLERTLGGAKKS